MLLNLNRLINERRTIIIHGEAIEQLLKLEANSIDFICTDPPYGIGFMGKEWDTFKPDIVAAGVRRSVRKDPVLAKAAATARNRDRGRIDAAGGMEAARYDHSPQGQRKFREWWYEISIELLRVLKPGAFTAVCIGARQDSVAAAITAMAEAGFKTDFTSIFWTYASGFPKAGNIGKLVDKRLGAEREATEPNPYAGRRKNSIAGNGATSTVSGGDYPIHPEMLTAPTTPQAKDLDGSYTGFQPKPAVEVIIVAMKPLSEKTFVDQALKNGKGISWLDDARIPTGDSIGTRPPMSEGGVSGDWSVRPVLASYSPSEQGRFPANLLVSDDVLNDGVVSKGQRSERGTGGFAAGVFEGGQADNYERGYADSGSYSRYFDLDRWASTLPFLIVPKAAKSEKNKGLDGFYCAIIDICKDENTEQVILLLRDILESIPNLSIVESGLRLTVQSPADILSTTLTRISQITESKIWNSLMLLPTSDSMRVALSKMELGINPANIAANISESMTKIGTSTSGDGLLAEDVKSVLLNLLLPLRKIENWKLKSSSHPTVKPVRLTSYLITLFSREGDIVLDPFVGSGTTCVAAQKLKRKYIGIEREAEYVEIAKARLVERQASLL